MQHYDEVTRLPPGTAWSRGLNARAAEVASPVMQHYDAVTNSPPGTTWSRELNAKALEAMEAQLCASLEKHCDAITIAQTVTWSKDLNKKAADSEAAWSLQRHYDAITEAAAGAAWSREMNLQAVEAWEKQTLHDSRPLRR